VQRFSDLTGVYDSKGCQLLVDAELRTGCIMEIMEARNLRKSALGYLLAHGEVRLS